MSGSGIATDPGLETPFGLGSGEVASRGWWQPGEVEAGVPVAGLEREPVGSEEPSRSGKGEGLGGSVA